MKILGLTGGIASGKSTILKWFTLKNIFVVDADKVNHDLLNKDSKVINEIAEVFGQSVINNGKIDRERLGKLVFSNDESRKKLETLLHPVIYRHIENMIKANSNERLIVLDIPLLFETNFDQLCDVTLVVYVNEDIQIERLMKRDNLNMADAIKRIKTQMPLDEKAKKATYVLDNSKTIEQTISQLEEIYKFL